MDEDLANVEESVTVTIGEQDESNLNVENSTEKTNLNLKMFY